MEKATLDREHGGAKLLNEKDELEKMSLDGQKKFEMSEVAKFLGGCRGITCLLTTLLGMDLANLNTRLARIMNAERKIGGLKIPSKLLLRGVGRKSTIRKVKVKESKSPCWSPPRGHLL